MMEDSKFSKAIKRADNLESKSTLIRRMLIVELKTNIEFIKLLEADVSPDVVINKLQTNWLETAIEENFNFGSFPIRRHTIHKSTARGDGFMERYVGHDTEYLFSSIHGKIECLREIVNIQTPQTEVDKRTRLLNIFKIIDLLLLHLSKKQTDVEYKALKVFLCHSSGDKQKVRELYNQLREDGIEPWLDEENLLPGQDWEEEIPKAVRNSDVVLICLSKRAVSKAGYVQKEIRFALDVAEEKPSGTIYLIPLKLEECDVPKRLEKWQWVDYFLDGGYERLMLSLERRAEETNQISKN